MTERRWEDLRPFAGEIPPDTQVLVIAGAGGSKSTLAATLLLDTDSLVALDGKDRLTLPRARIVELPKFPEHGVTKGPDADTLAAWDRAVTAAIARPTTRTPFGLRLVRGGERPTGRVIVRPHPLDSDDPVMHDRLFRAFWLTRLDTVLWLDEVTATGMNARSSGRYLRAISARGRTRGQGLWSLSQAAYELIPGIVRRNATYVIVGSIDLRDAAALPYDDVELAASIPRKSGRFLVYVAGEREPYRLYVPIPAELRHWEAP